MNSVTSNFVLFLLIPVSKIGTSLPFVLANSQWTDHHHIHDGRDGSNDFSNQWIVHLDGTSEAANLLAMKLGYENLGEVKEGYQS